MIDISNDQIYQTEQTKYLYHRKKEKRFIPK